MIVGWLGVAYQPFLFRFDDRYRYCKSVSIDFRLFYLVGNRNKKKQIEKRFPLQLGVVLVGPLLIIKNSKEIPKKWSSVFNVSVCLFDCLSVRKLQVTGFDLGTSSLG